MDDLQQAAYEGLVKAVYRFDITMGKDLLTYAVPTIRGELQRHFRDHSWTVRPPRRVQELQWRVNRCIEDLTQELGHEPSDGQVRDKMAISPAEYDEAIVAFGCFTPTSLDQPVSHEGASTVGDLLPDEAADDLDAAEARTALAPVIKELPERDKQIIYLRFFQDRTQEEIGAELGVTQMQVSRLLTRILRDLRSALGAAA
jgi:RNA polymerase sigma-B factor